jgi:hypothetical protein
MMITMCLIYCFAIVRSLEVGGYACVAGGNVEVEGGKVAGSEVSVGEAAVGFDPPAFGIATVGGRLVGRLQTERTRIETSITEWNRILISLLSTLLIKFS